MAWPRWRHTLIEAQRLAVKAIDEYNCSTGDYGVAAVQARVPYKFNTSDHTRLWQHFKLHGKGWTAPEGGETVSEYCVPNEPTRQYVFTSAWVDRIVKEVGTPEKYEAFFGHPPHKGEVTPIGAAPSKQEPPTVADAKKGVS